MKALGIDIGTTTVCGIVLDTENGKILDVQTLSNTSAVQGEACERLQDPEVILERTWQLCRTFLERFTEIGSIGLTGQMHGIVYCDAEGNAVSPLYTWQDESGNEKDEGERRYADRLSDLTGYPMASGFGLCTLYVHTKIGKIPENAASICTIPDYIGMKLTGRKTPVMTPSMAASLGLFDLEKQVFDMEKIGLAGIDLRLIPECRDGYCILGTTPEGIPVGAAVGDNQASVIGSVREPKKSVLVNVGTGSQVSVGIDHPAAARGVELRPLVLGEYILVGSGLCGGRAYAALEQFFEKTVEAMTGEKSGKLYNRMAALLDAEEETDLTADTRYQGTREDPSAAGSFTNLKLSNFTPAAMTRSVLKGVAEELYTYFEKMMLIGAQKPLYLVGSGNGIRMNPHLVRIFETMYGLPMQMPEHHEEAAFGCALYALCAAGIKRDLDEARTLIRYVEREG